MSATWRASRKRKQTFFQFYSLASNCLGISCLIVYLMIVHKLSSNVCFFDDGFVFAWLNILKQVIKSRNTKTIISNPSLRYNNCIIAQISNTFPGTLSFASCEGNHLMLHGSWDLYDFISMSLLFCHLATVLKFEVDFWLVHGRSLSLTN